MSTNDGGAKNDKKKRVNKGGRGYMYAPFEESPPPVPNTPREPVVDIVSSGPTMDGGAKKKRKKVKRKAGPYALFVKKHYDKVAKAHPKWKATDCIKEIAKMWKEQKK